MGIENKTIKLDGKFYTLIEIQAKMGREQCLHCVFNNVDMSKVQDALIAGCGTKSFKGRDYSFVWRELECT